jgi:membrane-associated phospholipid phosphatase
MIRSAWGRNALVLLSLVAAGLVFLPVDVPLSRWLMEGFLPGDVRGIFRRAEAFGHAYGLLAIALTIYFLDPQWMRRSPRLVIHGLAAGLAADLVKLGVWRVRPRFFEDPNQSSFAGTILTTDSWEWSTLLDSTRHSFPSAHTAVAVATALTLARFYPSARGWFVFLAFLCGMNRVDGGSHFASDVCWGAALGFVITQFCWRSPTIARFLSRWERLDRASVAATAEAASRQAA